jgi:hypothetical protein
MIWDGTLEKHRRPAINILTQSNTICQNKFASSRIRLSRCIKAVDQCQKRRRVFSDESRTQKKVEKPSCDHIEPIRIILFVLGILPLSCKRDKYTTQCVHFLSWRDECSSSIEHSVRRLHESCKRFLDELEHCLQRRNGFAAIDGYFVERLAQFKNRPNDRDRLECIAPLHECFQSVIDLYPRIWMSRRNSLFQ